MYQIEELRANYPFRRCRGRSKRCGTGVEQTTGHRPQATGAGGGRNPLTPNPSPTRGEGSRSGTQNGWSGRSGTREQARGERRETRGAGGAADFRTQNSRLGRSRTQAFCVLRPKVKCFHSKTLGSVFAGLGRLGRKIPVHLIEEGLATAALLRKQRVRSSSTAEFPNPLPSTPVVQEFEAGQRHSRAPSLRSTTLMLRALVAKTFASRRGDPSPSSPSASVRQLCSLKAWPHSAKNLPTLILHRTKLNLL